jgi:hypothetical protein
MTKGPRIFLAHASEDEEQVRKLYHTLKKRGLRPWLDKENLLGGQNWQIEIPKAIKECEYIINCLSKKSIHKKGYVQKEFRMALDQYAKMPAGSIYLIPLKLDDCEVPDIQFPELGVKLRDIQWIEYWKPDGLKRLLKAVRNDSSSRIVQNRPKSQDTTHQQSNKEPFDQWWKDLTAIDAEIAYKLEKDSLDPDKQSLIVKFLDEVTLTWSDPIARHWAYLASGKIGGIEAEEIIQRGLNDDNEFARIGAQKALKKIKG